MKNILTILISFFLTQTLFSQTCCQMKSQVASSDDMAVFVKDEKFVASHEEPLTYLHTSEVGGKMIDFVTKDTINANGYYIAAKKKSNKWLFVYQEWWGLNDFVKKEADNLYTQLKGEVNVLAIDMYDGKVATTREDAGKYMQGAKEERLETIVNGAIVFAGKKAKIASVGWCFGGAWSLKSALLEKNKAVGSVMYYGMPVNDVEKLKKLKCDVLGLFATEQWISKEVIETFATNMNSANKKLEYKIFEAAHAFANPSNPKFDEKAAKEANEMAITYLKDRLGVK